MIPSRAPGPMVSAGAGTITFFNSSISNSGATIVLPASIAANDLLVLFDYAMNGGVVPTAVTPSGWTQAVTAGSVGGSLGRMSVCWKSAAGTEGGTTITCMAATTWNDKHVLVFRPTGGTTWTPSSAFASTPGNTFATFSTITAGSAPGVVAAFGDDLSNGGADALTMSPAGTYVASTGGRSGYIVYNASPANNTPTGTAAIGAAGLWFTRS